MRPEQLRDRRLGRDAAEEDERTARAGIVRRLLAHRSDDPGTGQDLGPQVERLGGLPGGGIDGVDRAVAEPPAAAAGHGEAAIEPAERCDRGAHRGVDLGLVGQVRGRPAGTDPLGKVARVVGRPRHDEHPGTLGDGPFGGRRADARSSR